MTSKLIGLCVLQKGDATYTLSTKLALLVNIKAMHVPGEEVKFVASSTRFLRIKDVY